MLHQTLVAGLVFVVLGAIQWAWIDPNELDAGLFTGGALVTIVAFVLIVRGR